MTITLTISTLAVDTTTYEALDVTQVDNELLTHINNMINGLQKFEKIWMAEIATPSSPAANTHFIYPKSGGGIYTLNSAGTEVNLKPDILAGQVFS